MIKHLLVLFSLISFGAFAQTESSTNLPFPPRTVHYVMGSIPAGSNPIWITKGQNLYEFHTDTIRYVKHTSIDEAMNNKLLWIKSNGDMSCWTPDYLKGTDTISLSNRINTKLSIIDTTNKWQPKGSYISSEVDPTVPSYSKSLTGFSVIKSSTDPLYKSSSYVPAFTDITGLPTTLSGYGITDAYPLSGNPSGFLTSINSGQVISALGYTPYNATNPNGYITGITSSNVTTALGYTPVTNARTITINGTAQDLTANRSWTVGDLLSSGSYSNPSWITSLAQSKISYSGTTSQYVRGDGSLASFPSIPSAQVQSDWSQSNSSAVDYIKNKPTITSGTVTSVGISSTDLTVSNSPVTSSGTITVNLPNSGVTAGNYTNVTVNSKGIVTGASNPTVQYISAGTRNFNQAYIASTTNYADVRLSVQISANLSLTGGQGGIVYLEMSADGSTGWTILGQMSGSNTGALTIGLSTVQVTGGQICGLLPPGYYWRLRTNNTTGTPTYSFQGGTEISY